MNIYTSRIDQIIENNIKPNLKLIHQLKMNGAIDRKIAQVVGVSVKEFNQAKEAFPQLSEVLEDALEETRIKLSNIVFERAMGVDGRLDAKGELLPPDEKLALKILEKIDERFKAKVETTNVFRIEEVIKSLSGIEQEQEQEVELD